MSNNFNVGLPTNYNKLKSMANNKSSWRIRLKAVEELGKWKCQQSIDILWKQMNSDKVYLVQQKAFLKLQAFGEQVKLPKKKKGDLIKGIHKKLATVKNSLPKKHTFDDFKKEFMKKRSVEYDTYEGDTYEYDTYEGDTYEYDKEKRFDKWLKNVWKNIPQK